MTKLPLIEIRPVLPTSAAETERRKGDLYDRQFVDAGTACDFMIGKKWCGWKLYIRGRLYNWPVDKGSIERYLLKNHIKDCIETDTAFYG